MKVFTLQGLLRFDRKYDSMVSTTYTDNLNDAFERLTDMFQTVEDM